MGIGRVGRGRLVAKGDNKGDCGDQVSVRTERVPSGALGEPGGPGFRRSEAIDILSTDEPLPGDAHGPDVWTIPREVA